MTSFHRQTCCYRFSIILLGIAMTCCYRNSLIAAEKTGVVKEIKTDLLIVGGTESGWAAAIQAARLDVKKSHSC